MAFKIVDEEYQMEEQGRNPEVMGYVEGYTSNTIGKTFLTGGCLLVAAGVGLAALLVANIWIAASNKWRRILRAESLIYEYRQNRDEFLRWKYENYI